MCSIGLFDYLRQAGSVHLHEQNTLSDEMYAQLKSAQKMIKSAIKDSNLRVDIWDGCTVPEDKFVYAKDPDCVYVEVKDLLQDTVEADEFWKKDRTGEPTLRRIFRFIDKNNGVEKSPIEEMKHSTRTKYYYYMNKYKNQAVNGDIYSLIRSNLIKLNVLNITG